MRAPGWCWAPLKLGAKWGNTHPLTTMAIRWGLARLGPEALKETEGFVVPGGTPQIGA